MFSLHPQLEKDCHLAVESELSLILLMDDSQYPWLIQVPKLPNMRELIDLNDAQQRELWRESALICKVLQTSYRPDKLNVAALGNMVEQLHVHHIARFKTDAAWPAPVWGKLEPLKYSQQQLTATLQTIRQGFSQIAQQESKE